jgi:hypothetical protein
VDRAGQGDRDGRAQLVVALLATAAACEGENGEQEDAAAHERER